jgi:hypothetical protein
MNTLVFVLSAFLGTADDPSLWQSTYAEAERVAAQENKSVAVFLTPGQMNQLIPGGVNQQAREMLSKNYVAVMVDTTTPEGQTLARAFEITNGQGLVLSDRGGVHQAFWYQGNLNNQDLVRNLQKFANQTNVRMTQVAGRTSYYPSASDDQANPMPQATTAPQSQRRMGMRNSSEQRTRLLQGRMMSRRATTY